MGVYYNGTQITPCYAHPNPIEYGVRWVTSQSSPTLERVVRNGGAISLWDITFTPNVGGDVHTNPFDAIPLFNPQVVLDSYGNKFARFPRFYKAVEQQAEYTYVWVCEKQISPNYVLPQAFYRTVNNARVPYWNYVDIGCYEAGETTIGGATTICSKPGFYPSHNRTRAQFYSYAKVYNTQNGDTTNEYYQITTLSEITEILQPLMMIICGSKNAQSAYVGYGGCRYTGGYAITSFSGNTITLTQGSAPNTVARLAAEFRKGACIVTNTSSSSPSSAGFTNYFTITDVQTTSTTCVLTLDGSVPTGTTYIFSRPVKTGETDIINATSGTISNDVYEPATAAYGNGGMYSFKMLNIENIYGNIWKNILDLSIESYVPYVYRDIEQPSTWAEISTPSTSSRYIKGDYSVASSSQQWIQTVNLTPSPQEVVLPTAVGGSASSSTNYCDYYWVNSGVRTSFFGGACSSGSAGGLWSFNLNNVLGISIWNLGARLSKRSL